MKRLGGRLLVTAVSLSLLIASCAWFAGRSRVMVAAMPLPFGEFSVRGDAEGWCLQHFPESSTNWPRMTVVPQPPRRAVDWRTALDDLNPTWLTPAFVYAEWDAGTSNGRRSRLIGVKHYVVVPVLAIITFAAARWFRRGWPTGADPE